MSAKRRNSIFLLAALCLPAGCLGGQTGVPNSRSADSFCPPELQDAYETPYVALARRGDTGASVEVELSLMRDASEPQTAECGPITTAAVSVTLRIGAQVLEPMSGVLEGDAAQATLSFATDSVAADERPLGVASGRAILGDGLRALHLRLFDGDEITLNAAALESATRADD